MKKLLSILLMLCLLVAPVCAQAQANEVSALIYAIDLYLGDPDNPITLDTSLWLDFVQGEAGTYGLVGLYDASDEPIAMAGVGVDGSGVTGYVDGMSNTYHLSQEALGQLLAALEEEMGMSMDEALSSITSTAEASTEATEAVAASVEKMLAAWEEAFAPLEWTVGSVEEVLVLDQMLSMQRQDLIVPEENIKMAVQAFATFMDEVVAAAPESVEVDADDMTDFLNALQEAGLSAEIRSWADEMGNMRVEMDLNITADGETLTVPLVLEMLYGEGTENIRLSCDMEMEEEYLFMVVDYYDNLTETGESAGVQIYASVSSMDSFSDVGLYFTRDVEEGVTSLTFEVMTSDEDESYDIGAYYSYEDMVADDGTPVHAAYVNLWVTTGMNTEYETTYAIDFLMDVYTGTVDEDGTLPVSDVGQVEFDQMTEEQMAQAQNELSSVLSSLLTGLMADSGVQTLMTLFGGAEVTA